MSRQNSNRIEAMREREHGRRRVSLRPGEFDARPRRSGTGSSATPAQNPAPRAAAPQPLWPDFRALRNACAAGWCPGDPPPPGVPVKNAVHNTSSMSQKNTVARGINAAGREISNSVKPLRTLVQTLQGIRVPGKPETAPPRTRPTHMPHTVQTSNTNKPPSLDGIPRLAGPFPIEPIDSPPEYYSDTNSPRASVSHENFHDTVSLPLPSFIAKNEKDKGVDIGNAANQFGIDPNLLAAILLDEQRRRGIFDLTDSFRAKHPDIFGQKLSNASLGAGQIKFSTARRLYDAGYYPSK